MRVLQLIPRYGLGNRLMAVASGLRLVNMGKFDELRVCWHPSGDLDIPIHAIMDGPYVVNDAPAEESVYFNYVGIPNDSKIPLLPQITVEAFHPFTFEGDKTPFPKVNQQLGNALRSLTFKADPTLDVSGCVGIHCRRSDYLVSHTDSTAYHRFIDQAFAEVVAQQCPTGRLFLATDSAETDGHFRRQFGDRLVTLPKKHYPVMANRPADTVMEGLLDLLLLSRCQKILADSYSTFSTVAGWLGGIEKFIWHRPGDV